MSKEERRERILTDYPYILNVCGLGSLNSIFFYRFYFIYFY